MYSEKISSSHQILIQHSTDVSWALTNVQVLSTDGHLALDQVMTPAG